MKPKASPQLLELCAVLASASQPDADSVPPGWHTRQDLMAAQGLGKSVAHKRIQRGVALGQIERRSFRIFCGNNVRPVPHYRVKP